MPVTEPTTASADRRADFAHSGSKTAIRYVVITPVRNEANFLSSLIDSLAGQTLKPQQWVVVDDGSKDGTAEIVENAAGIHSWIILVRRADRGSREPGKGVIEAFSDGYRHLKADWDFLVKLDGDVSFDSDYFERCFAHFAKDPKLGIGGGTICQMLNNRLVTEAPGDPVFHVRGATKIYRRECWEALGGLIQAPGWDTVDEYKANMLGWTTYTFPELKLEHHRFAGRANGTWRNWVKNGLANYVAGYHPVFMACKCGKRLFARPYAVGALGLMIGFVSGYLHRVPQVGDLDLVRYVRRQQLRKLTFRESLWNRKSP
jgi:biofilm PGA synthesis N-glycosyltransferase PgaC